MTMFHKAILATAMTAAMCTTASAAKPASTQTPAAVQRLLACRALADPAARLACFDRETAAIDKAMSARDLIVVDRERARATRRELFGLSIPSFGGLFGDGDKDAISEITSTIAGIGRNADGGWILKLADGSTWTQMDDTMLGADPRKGQKVVVRRAALGSFRISVNGQPGYKAKRIG